MDGGLEAWDRDGLPLEPDGRACRGSLGRSSRSRCSRSLAPARRRGRADARAGGRLRLADRRRLAAARPRAGCSWSSAAGACGSSATAAAPARLPRHRRPRSRPTASAGCCRSPSRPTTRRSGPLLRLPDRRGPARRAAGARVPPLGDDPDRADPTGRIVWSTAARRGAPTTTAASSSSGPTGCCGSRPATAAAGNDSSATRATSASQLGKLLRIDPRPGNGGGYTIPADNPFGTAVWALRPAQPVPVLLRRPRHRRPLHRRRRPGHARGDRLGSASPTGLGRGADYGWSLPRGRRSRGRRACSPGASYLAPIFDYAQARHRAR